jgi:P27 family predicted phage terminase small subunit
MGRTPEPIGLKILKGNGRGKDCAGRPIPDVPRFEKGVPDCPPWLSPGAKEVWETYAPMLADIAMIKVADGLVFAALCETAASYSAAVQGVWEQGEVLVNPKTGCAHKNPLVGVSEAARRDLLKLASQFGLTPAAEIALARPAAPDSDADDPFGWEGTS